MCLQIKYLRGGGRTAKYNTTDLFKHIQKQHAKEHAEFLQLKQNQRSSRQLQPGN